MKRAFTLVELLAVIAITGILAALLLPVLNRAKASVQRTVCLNNLRQISSSVRMYADDSNDAAPKTPWTTNSTHMYMDGVAIPAAGRVAAAIAGAFGNYFGWEVHRHENSEKRF